MHPLVNSSIRNAFRHGSFFARPVAHASSTPTHKKFESENKTVILPRAALKPSVAQLQNDLADTYFSMLFPAYMTPSFLVPWAAITETPVLLSPLALTILIATISVTADLSSQAYLIKKEAKMSLIMDCAGPANEQYPNVNDTALQLLASKNADITFNTDRVIIKGRVASPTPDTVFSSSSHP